MTAVQRFARITSLSTAVTVLLVVAPAAAMAATPESTTETYSGRDVSIQWEQVDEVAGAFGNWHVGYLNASQAGKGKANVWVSISDYLCDEGETPWGGHGGHAEPADGVVTDGGHGDEPVEGGCDYIGERYGDGQGLAFTMKANLSRATLKGSVTLYGGAHGEAGPVGTPPIDIVVTGVGPQGRSSSSYSYTRGRETYEGTSTSRDRNGSVTGTIGPMGFTAERSSAWMSKYTSTYTYTYR